MTIVTRKAHDDEDSLALISMARQALARAFGDDEPEYTRDDIKRTRTTKQESSGDRS
jgi:hypothetical protein